MLRRLRAATVQRLIGPLLALGLVVAAGSCGPNVALDSDGEGDGDGVPTMPPSETGPSANLEAGGTANVTADFLNLRDMPGTTGNILIAMPCGALVEVLQGPTTTPVAGWWQVRYTAPNDLPYAGWCSGKFLIGAADFDPTTCGATGPDGGTLTGDGGVIAPTTDVSAIFDRARKAVGYSYWWGHGAWRTDHTSLGTCSGSCPSCDHAGAYGADCSGFVAKAWQVPSASALSVDQHPYSTYDFYNYQLQWAQIDRAQLAPADAMVRRTDSSGHIVLVESADDPYGALWLYEARGCATGVVHNMRTIDTSYRAIRRDGL